MWDSFWDFIWYTIVVFAFVAYLVILFHVIGDLFRDNTTSGWVKAAWILFLVFIPYIALFVYLIARGGGMAERSVEAHEAARKQADEYIRRTAGTSAADQISTAKGLLDDGVIDRAEFEQLKSAAMSA
ncbi:phospholipase D-like protein [Williamsia limnetica]|uniref:Phospholipase D-like protein n=1 Tax=Williamsia limnetica TaxID=882452 RepID=A0A318RJA9_WILLI|nr:SHOCT domain-containing protein [Williamsia limnetica]PYE17861.1 phospholipase D-like protein [Williamsia limnetica]